MQCPNASIRLCFASAYCSSDMPKESAEPGTDTEDSSRRLPGTFSCDASYEDPRIVSSPQTTKLTRRQDNRQE